MPMPETKHAVRSIGPIFPISMNPRLWPMRAAANQKQGARVFCVASEHAFVLVFLFYFFIYVVHLGGSARDTRACLLRAARRQHVLETLMTYPLGGNTHRRAGLTDGAMKRRKN